ncbi:MAG TPA: hypothetical protein VMV86_02580 [Methanosarcinales archaeon]|nr:hypothetical protein [Methanosarcinales archaeon]
MNIQGAVVLKGQFRVTHLRDGQILSEEVFDNTITNTGKKETAGLLNEQATGGFKWIGLGSSSTTAVAADTALVTAITAAGLARAAATCSKATTTVAGDTAQLVKTFTATATQAVREAGIFDSSTAGIMLARQTFAAKNMEANDTLAVTYKIKVA